MTYDQLLDIINGLTWKTSEGIHGVLQVEKQNGMTEIVHYPSAYGRRSKAYREQRKILGDDFTSTLIMPESDIEDSELFKVFQHAEKLGKISSEVV